MKLYIFFLLLGSISAVWAQSCSTVRPPSDVCKYHTDLRNFRTLVSGKSGPPVVQPLREALVEETAALFFEPQ